MEVGSIWGTAGMWPGLDRRTGLHREATARCGEVVAIGFTRGAMSAAGEEQARLKGRLEQVYRVNTYDPATGVSASTGRARAFDTCLAQLFRVFHEGEYTYAIPAGTVTTPVRMREFATFILLDVVGAAANRPGAHLLHAQLAP